MAPSPWGLDLFNFGVKMKKNSISFLIFFVFLYTIYSTILASNSLFINQVGYNPSQPKLVYSEKPSDSFGVYSLDGKLLFEGKFKNVASDDKATGMDLYAGDFSEFIETGRYIIKSEDGQKSYEFEIKENIYSDLINAVQKTFYLQRCGTELNPKYAEEFAHGRCHYKDAHFHPSTDTSGYHNVTGGWHDAGDYGKYVQPGAATVSMLFYGLQLFPEFLSTDDLNIPESGNGIPDLIDEIKYELRWMFKMQRWDGAVWEKVHTKDYVNFVLPDYSEATRYIYIRSTMATASFAGIMAYAYRIFHEYDTEFADSCLTKARHSYEYLVRYPNILPEAGFRNPKDTSTGGYADRRDKDERLWASAELFISTGEKKYLEYFKNNYDNGAIFYGPITCIGLKASALMSFMLAELPSEYDGLQTKVKNDFFRYCDDMLGLAQIDGFGVALGLREYVWGSNDILSSKGIMLAIAHRLTGEQKYADCLARQLDYFLGLNCNNFSYVSGFGTKAAFNIHHAPSAGDRVEYPVPGFLVGGPDGTLGDHILKEHFERGTPPAKCYVDILDSYASNEITIYANAALLVMSAYLNGIN